MRRLSWFDRIEMRLLNYLYKREQARIAQLAALFEKGGMPYTKALQKAGGTIRYFRTSGNFEKYESIIQHHIMRGQWSEYDETS